MHKIKNILSLVGSGKSWVVDICCKYLLATLDAPCNRVLSYNQAFPDWRIYPCERK